MPGPLSTTVTRKRVAWLAAGGGDPLLTTTSTVTTTSGRMPASSAASRALSTASFTHVRSALRGLSKPRRWRFLVKNSETEISRWRAPISTADTAVVFPGTAGFAGSPDFGAAAGGGASAVAMPSRYQTIGRRGRDIVAARRRAGLFTAWAERAAAPVVPRCRGPPPSGRAGGSAPAPDPATRG